jgi:ABC-2 type transport system ATP-binding protein
MENQNILVENLTKKYASQKTGFAIQDINLDIGRGKLFGLIGPDGAGKSTTLRILATILPQTSGNVHIFGYDISTQPEEVRKLIGYMPQNFSLYLDLSVIENLDFFASIQRVPAAERQERIEKMLSFTHLERFKQRRARDLSGGMKKKLALACALVHNPKLLILDEPSTGVDPVSRRELWSILAEVVQNDVTVIASTPYMDEAERCHSVAIMYQGTIIASGSPAALRTSLPYDIIEVKAKPRKATRILISQITGIHDWRPVGDRFRLSVEKNANEPILENLKSALEAEKLDVRILRKASSSMEDVFIYQAQNSRGKA